MFIVFDEPAETWSFSQKEEQLSSLLGGEPRVINSSPWIPAILRGSQTRPSQTTRTVIIIAHVCIEFCICVTDYWGAFRLLRVEIKAKCLGDHVILPYACRGGCHLFFLLGVWWGQSPQQCQIWPKSATCTTAHGNTRSLTHWAIPGIEPGSSWLLVRFVSTEPQRELPFIVCFFGWFFFLVLIVWPLPFSIPRIKKEPEA